MSKSQLFGTHYVPHSRDVIVMDKADVVVELELEHEHVNWFNQDALDELYTQTKKRYMSAIRNMYLRDGLKNGPFHTRQEPGHNIQRGRKKCGRLLFWK